MEWYTLRCLKTDEMNDCADLTENTETVPAKRP